MIERISIKVGTKITTLDGRNVNSHWLKLIPTETLNAEDIVRQSALVLFDSIQKKRPLTDTAVVIGTTIRRLAKLARDTDKALFAGLVVLEEFVEEGVIGWHRAAKQGGKREKHPSYKIFVKDWSKWNQLREENSAESIPKELTGYPQKNEPWTSGTNSDGLELIRGAHPAALASISEKDHPVLLKAINKLQDTPYRINKDVFTIWKACRSLKANSPFKEIAENNAQRRESFKIEADAIGTMAEYLIDKDIYHTYNCDFRGRIYNCTNFLEEQASDQAKALLVYKEGAPMGPNGLQYLYIHTSNVWGVDKVSLEDRITFVEEHFDTFVSYAEDPLKNSGWMGADKVWSFLSCCIELRNIRNWLSQGLPVETYESHMVCYIDGSNNGIQHLVAMSRDENAAPHVNLVETDSASNLGPGDIYMYVADLVWKQIAIDAKLTDKDTQKQFETIKKTVASYKKTIAHTKNKLKKELSRSESESFRTANEQCIRDLSAVFWNQWASNKKIQRKMVKRNVMTIGYGATIRGMGDQCREDTPDITEDCRWMAGAWPYWFGRLVYRTCYEHLKGPAKMLTMFRELAKRENDLGRFMAYQTPKTNFPVVQYYLEPKTKQVTAKFMGKEVRFQLQYYESLKLNKRAQLSGAAPNITHSLDAGHLTLVVAETPFPTTTVHDSFGSAAGNMSDLWMEVREQFVELYDKNPLEDILTQLGSMDLMPTVGTWKVEEMLQSDFSFC